MRQVTSCVWVALLSGVLAIPTKSDDSKWVSFKALHGKNYPPHEEPFRKKLFLESLARTNAHNKLYEKGLVSSAIRPFQYSDLPPEEIVVQGLLPRRNLSYLLFPPKRSPNYLPENFDWRDLNLMTPVRNQGRCGACYAFASIAVLEAHLKWKTGKTYDLSEQDILDCSYRKYGDYNKGCDGGMFDYAFLHLIYRGAVSEDQHPYYSGNGTFRNYCPPLTRMAEITKLQLTRQYFYLKNEHELAQVVYHYGPVVVSVACTSEMQQFKYLGDGIFDEPKSINAKPTHSVVLVGFGTQNGTDYWIIKNSYGENWGEGGYGKIRRGVNMCNIINQGASYIKVQK